MNTLLMAADRLNWKAYLTLQHNLDWKQPCSEGRPSLPSLPYFIKSNLKYIIHLCGGQGQKETFRSWFSLLDPGNQTQVLRLSGKHLYLLSHLAGNSSLLPDDCGPGQAGQASAAGSALYAFLPWFHPSTLQGLFKDNVWFLPDTLIWTNPGITFTFIYA